MLPSQFPLDVCLTVNGKEIPFTQTVNNLMERMRKHNDDAIMIAATNLVANPEINFDEVGCLLQETETEIRSILDLAIIKANKIKERINSVV